MATLRLATPLLKVPSMFVNIGQQTAGFRSRIITKSDAKWRRENQLPAIHNSYGPLANLPDYTFEDGRPTPLGSHQKKRLLQHREYAERIVQLSQELDSAKERLPRLQREQAEKRQQTLDQKLKPKGHRLLQK